MINVVLKNAEDRMQKSADALKHELAKVRTGRAHTSLLDHIRVPYYGVDTPLNQVANVVVDDPRSLLVTPWEKSMVQAVEKAIRTSDLGLNPVGKGDAIRVPVPSLTEDRRRDLIKIVKSETENARVAIRNIRRDANNELKELLKEKEISEDDERRSEEKIQKLTDKFISLIDKMLAEKETDLMSV